MGRPPSKLNIQNSELERRYVCPLYYICGYKFLAHSSSGYFSGILETTNIIHELIRSLPRLLYSLHLFLTHFCSRLFWVKTVQVL
jgi:hypothetical protein